MLCNKRENVEIPAIHFSKCCAKTDKNNNPGMTVEQHLLIVSEVCSILGRQRPKSLYRLILFAIYAAALHDIGKISPGFQLKYFREMIAELVPELASISINHFCTDHSHTGACALWAQQGDPFSDPPVVAQIAAMHHGSIRKDPLPTDIGEIFGGSHWSLQRCLLIEKMEKQFSSQRLESFSPTERDCMAGMVTISDWIGSDEEFFPPDGRFNNESIRKIAESAIKNCGLEAPVIKQSMSFRDIFDFMPFDIQEQMGAIATVPGVYILEAPMGMGKTEAALYAAYQLMASGCNTGLFFGLPTRLTSDRIHERVQCFIEKICTDAIIPKLAHGTAWLREFKKGAEEMAPGNSWFSPRKRALLHPFVVGTIDQALMAVLRVKHHFVRTFALAGKVVILDEVHSYDGYTGTLLDELVHRLSELHCSVIILSATLTAERRAAFFKRAILSSTSAYPLITGESNYRTSKPPETKIYSVSIQDLTGTGVAELAISRARKKDCVLCIANTVSQAQDWYDKVLTEMHSCEFEVGLLHSKFPGFRRAKIEEYWLNILGKNGKRPQGCILIATQVVEQSVDIDVDFLITELAPTDMLLQRMGRQWRHAQTKRACTYPETVIVSGDPGNASDLESLYEILGVSNCKVYAPWVLCQTRFIWEKYHEIRLPDDIRTLLEDTYTWHPESASTLMKDLREAFETMSSALKRKAQGMLSGVTLMPTSDDLEGCATRYSDLPTTQVLLVKNISDNTEKSASLELANCEKVAVNTFQHDFHTMVELHRNLISIATYLVAKTGAALRTPKYLEKYFYEQTPVLEWDEPGGEISIDGHETDFHYSHQKGLFRTKAFPSSDNNCVSYSSEWEEIDVFDKSRFDW